MEARATRTEKPPSGLRLRSSLVLSVFAAGCVAPSLGCAQAVGYVTLWPYDGNYTPRYNLDPTKIVASPTKNGICLARADEIREISPYKPSSAPCNGLQEIYLGIMEPNGCGVSFLFTPTSACGWGANPPAPWVIDYPMFQPSAVARVDRYGNPKQCPAYGNPIQPLTGGKNLLEELGIWSVGSQRFTAVYNTLRKVAQEIIDHQHEFLDKGPEFIQPLKMQQIADRVGVHVTTVSRAVDEKWIQTARGLFPLKRFFGGGTQSSSGEDVAWDTIRIKLQELIDKEDKKDPLSDDALVDALAAQGITLARRTITKYRKQMQIPSSRQRREY